VESGRGHGFARQPSHEAKAGGAEFWMSWTNSDVRFQPV
jgi:hypothetical protein